MKNSIIYMKKRKYNSKLNLSRKQINYFINNQKNTFQIDFIKYNMFNKIFILLFYCENDIEVQEKFLIN